MQSLQKVLCIVYFSVSLSSTPHFLLFSQNLELQLDTDHILHCQYLDTIICEEQIIERR